MFLFSGCSIPLKSKESIHYLIIGFGVVSVPKGNEEKAIQASSSKSLGIIVSNQPDIKLGLGYTSNNTVLVGDGAKDIRTEISQRPFGPLVIKVDNAVLDNDKIKRRYNNDKE